MTHTALLNKDQAELDLIRDFLTLANSIDKDKPDPAQLKELRRMLVEHPHLWQAAGDLAYTAALRIITNLKTDLAITESLRQGWQTLKEDLGYPTATPLERLMIDQVILCWLQLNLTQCFYADINLDRMPLPTLNYWEKRLSAAQNRYLKACQALARTSAVRVKSPVQLNIAAAGGQQLNMINPFPAAAEAQPVEPDPKPFTEAEQNQVRDLLLGHLPAAKNQPRRRSGHKK